jgi:hypothetical protein
MNDITLPTYDELMNPLLQALRMLGGSGSIEEIYAKTVEVTGLSEEVLAQLHDPERTSENTACWKTPVVAFGHLRRRPRA